MRNPRRFFSISNKYISYLFPVLLVLLLPITGIASKSASLGGQWETQIRNAIKSARDSFEVAPFIQCDSKENQIILTMRGKLKNSSEVKTIKFIGKLSDGSATVTKDEQPIFSTTFGKDVFNNGIKRAFVANSPRCQ